MLALSPLLSLSLLVSPPLSRRAGGITMSDFMSDTSEGSVETLRPATVDAAAAAASQEGTSGPPVDFEPPKPLIASMRVGGGQLAGDIGFDPLELADSPESLAWYREAEVKHARLAMLAAVGWPVAEKLNGPLSAAFGQQSLLVGPDGMTPSLLNGGLGQVSLVYWLAALGLGVAAENAYMSKQLGRSTSYVPGMVGFDPLGLDGPATRSGEIWAGRVAMLAVVVYAAEEALTKEPIVRETAFLFQPIWSLGGMGQALDDVGMPAMADKLGDAGIVPGM